MKQTILNCVDDFVSDFTYYDRKEDEDLSQEKLDEAIESGEITVDEIVEYFRSKLQAIYPKQA